MFQVNIESLEGAITVRLSGNLDQSAREHLLKTVKGEVGEKGGKVILDCGNLSSLDSEGVRALLALQAWLRIKESEMVLAGLPAAMEEPIKSDPGVDKFLKRHASVSEAMEQLGIQSPPANISSPVVAAPFPESPPAAPTPTPPPVVASVPPTTGGWGAPPPVEVPASSPPPVSTGWGSPPPVEAPASSPSPVSTGWGSPPPAAPTPLGASAAPPVSPPSPWESPIPTESVKPMPKAETAPEPVVAPPPGSWDAAPKTDWPKGPPPTPGFSEAVATAPSRQGSSKLIPILGGIAALVVVGLGIWYYLNPGGGKSKEPVQAFRPPTIEPGSADVTGAAGEAPVPGEVSFTLENIDKNTIEMTPPSLSWATMAIAESGPPHQVTIKFSALPAQKPSEDTLFIKAKNEHGDEVSARVNLIFKDPEVEKDIVFLDQKLTVDSGRPLSGYRVALEGGEEGVVFEGQELPAPFQLDKNGFLSSTENVPASPPEYRFVIKATRTNGVSKSQPFTLEVVQNKAGDLLQRIVDRQNQVDLRAMPKRTLHLYNLFVKDILPKIKQAPESYVQEAALVMFPLGGSDLNEEEVRAQLEAPEVEKWMETNGKTVRCLVAGFADKGTGTTETNRNIVNARGQSLAKVVAKWLQKHGLNDIEDRVFAIPIMPLEDGTIGADKADKYRAAECWLVRAEISQ